MTAAGADGGVTPLHVVVARARNDDTAAAGARVPPLVAAAAEGHATCVRA